MLLCSNVLNKIEYIWKCKGNMGKLHMKSMPTQQVKTKTLSCLYECSGWSLNTSLHWPHMLLDMFLWNENWIIFVSLQLITCGRTLILQVTGTDNPLTSVVKIWKYKLTHNLNIHVNNKLPAKAKLGQSWFSLLIMSLPLFLVWIPLALASALASAWNFLVCSTSPKSVNWLFSNLQGYFTGTCLRTDYILVYSTYFSSFRVGMGSHLFSVQV